MSKPALFIKTRCQPGKRDEVRRLWEQHLKPRVQDGDTQDAYFYCYDLQDPNTFYIFELYASQDAMEANSKAPWFWEYVQAAGPLLDGQPEVGMTTAVWGKGVPV